jgi:hypothetical protein
LVGIFSPRRQGQHTPFNRASFMMPAGTAMRGPSPMSRLPWFGAAGEELGTRAFVVAKRAPGKRAAVAAERGCYARGSARGLGQGTASPLDRVQSAGSLKPEWRNGIRNGLKIRRGNPWGFESPLRHHPLHKLLLEHACHFEQRRIVDPVQIEPFKEHLTETDRGQSRWHQIARVADCPALLKR